MTLSLPRPHTHIVVTEFDGGESVLVDLNTKRYYQLNETATVIWRGLADGSSMTNIIGSLMSVYDVTEDDAARSIDEVLQHLRAHRLVASEESQP